MFERPRGRVARWRAENELPSRIRPTRRHFVRRSRPGTPKSPEYTKPGGETLSLFLPGWGTTAEVWAPFATPGDRLGGEIEAGAEVVAWSLGAMRALEVATSTPLTSLTVVGASGQFVRSSGYRFGWPARTLLRMRERLATDAGAGAVLDEFLALAFAPGEEVVQTPREQDSATLDQGLAFLADYSMLERAQDIHCPVRLLHGGRDRVCPPAAAELLAAALPQAELTVWPEAGHAPFLSQPDRFRSWLLH